MIRGIFLLFMVLCSFNFNAALECVTCNWDASQPHNNFECFQYVDNTSANAPSLLCSTGLTSPYCRTAYTYQNGIISQIVRGCSYGNTDHDLSSTNVPTEDKCVSMFTPATRASILCFSPCTTDSCNTERPDSFSACELDCGSNGNCNLFTGTCECNEGFSGNQCQTTVSEIYLRCVQCDGETDSNCNTFNTASNCPTLSHRYCAATSITRLDSDGTVINRLVSKSCTTAFVEDKCDATAANDGFVDYTCKTTCDSDGCNTEIPDDSPADNRLRCVICDSSNGVNSCATKTAVNLCPSSSTHCTAEVSYFISVDDERVIGINEGYELINVTRECSSSMVARECTDEDITGTRLKKVTCRESCSEYGCNTGWPARPKCSQCNCSPPCTRSSECYANPAEPTSCPFPYQNYCVVEDRNRGKNDTNDGFVVGFHRSVLRYCSHYSSGNQCNESTLFANTLENCNRTCMTDGCNLGSGVDANMMSAHLYLVPLIFMSIMTCIF